MPTYGYQCIECKHEFSVFQAMKDDPIATCPECGSPVKRLLYPVGIVFKGSGWYVNDLRKPDTSELQSKPAEGATAASEGAKSDGSKADAPGDKAASSSDKSDSSGSKADAAVKPAPAPASAAAEK